MSMGTTALGRTIRLYLVDGTATGVITAEVMNWTGKAIVSPRAKLPDLVRRSETERSGIYLLIGEDPSQPTKPKVYVGESDNVAKRLIQHNKDEQKEFWERVVLVISKDENLTKGHIRYLEGRLIQAIAAAGRATLINGTNPDYAYLPEPDIADMGFFLEQIRLVLPVLGFDITRPRPTVPPDNAAAKQAPLVTFTMSVKGVQARATEVDGTFVVLAGSTARADGKAAWNSYKGQRDRLIAESKLLPTTDPEFLTFAEDISFASPSAAAAIVLDRNSNGRIEWRVEGSRQTYADWQDAQIARAEAEAKQ
ncbi:MAG: GIY-YIG nuclease family protein [Rhodospirillales bacterium]|nr:GIY-YIG nuclease family protein [Rhodospirillales bacterium]